MNLALAQNINVSFLVGMGVGLSIGAIVGYLIAKRNKQPDGNVTLVQMLAVVTLFGYIIVSFTFNRDVSWIIAVAILATGYGVRGGQILEKVLERK